MRCLTQKKEILMQAKAKDQGGKSPGDETDFESDSDPETEFDFLKPGKPFMARLGTHLKFYFQMKVAKDAVWNLDMRSIL